MTMTEQRLHDCKLSVTKWNIYSTAATPEAQDTQRKREQVCESWGKEDHCKTVSSGHSKVVSSMNLDSRVACIRPQQSTPMDSGEGLEDPVHSRRAIGSPWLLRKSEFS